MKGKLLKITYRRNIANMDKYILENAEIVYNLTHYSVGNIPGLYYGTWHHNFHEPHIIIIDLDKFDRSPPALPKIQYLINEAERKIKILDYIDKL